MKMDFLWKKSRDFMVGSKETKERDGLIVKLANLAVVKKVKNVKVILRVVPPKACAAAVSVIKRVENVSVGKKALHPNS
jgi:hypothetical protein